jgi:hypothetical protein
MVRRANSSHRELWSHASSWCRSLGEGSRGESEKPWLGPEERAETVDGRDTGTQRN